jgi:hypothetical protein
MHSASTKTVSLCCAGFFVLHRELTCEEAYLFNLPAAGDPPSAGCSAASFRDAIERRDFPFVVLLQLPSPEAALAQAVDEKFWPIGRLNT